MLLSFRIWSNPDDSRRGDWLLGYIKVRGLHPLLESCPTHPSSARKMYKPGLSSSLMALLHSTSNVQRASCVFVLGVVSGQAAAAKGDCLGFYEFGLLHRRKRRVVYWEKGGEALLRLSPCL